MKFHVLPGDALAEDFKRAEIEADETIVCRECLIEGAVDGENLQDFWTVRANFINLTYGSGDAKYRKQVVGEFEKLQNTNGGDEIYLWFEHDLFCQANMWFCLSLLSESETEIYRVAPLLSDKKEIWKGFGKSSADDLRKCFERKIKFSREGVRLGANLWTAYRNKDYAELEKLGKIKSECFPKLEVVCLAEIEKDVRPQRALKKIIAEGATDFGKVFEIFSRREGIYGFGDAQLKNIYEAIKK